MTTYEQVIKVYPGLVCWVLLSNMKGQTRYALGEVLSYVGYERVELTFIGGDNTIVIMPISKLFIRKFD